MFVCVSVCVCAHENQNKLLELTLLRQNPPWWWAVTPTVRLLFYPGRSFLVLRLHNAALLLVSWINHNKTLQSICTLTNFSVPLLRGTQVFSCPHFSPNFQSMNSRFYFIVFFYKIRSGENASWWRIKAYSHITIFFKHKIVF